LASLLCILVVLTGTSAGGQEPKRTLEGHDLGGENTSFVFDSIIADARRTGETVIVISRLGKEDADRMNARRLHNAVTRLVDYPVGLPVRQVVAAIGQRTDGPGLVEV